MRSVPADVCMLYVCACRRTGHLKLMQNLVSCISAGAFSSEMTDSFSWGRVLGLMLGRSLRGGPWLLLAWFLVLRIPRETFLISKVHLEIENSSSEGCYFLEECQKGTVGHLSMCCYAMFCLGPQ